MPGISVRYMVAHAVFFKEVGYYRVYGDGSRIFFFAALIVCYLYARCTGFDAGYLDFAVAVQSYRIQRDDTRILRSCRVVARTCRYQLVAKCFPLIFGNILRVHRKGKNKLYFDVRCSRYRVLVCFTRSRFGNDSAAERPLFYFVSQIRRCGKG